MAYALLSSLFCCCSKTSEENDILDERDAYDETRRLIPDALGGGDNGMFNQALLDQQRMQQKLDTIVRAKERKMVNVGSDIPFNLHNVVLPPPPNHSISRNASGTMEYFEGTDEYDAGMYYQQHQQQQKPYPPAPYGPRFTTTATSGAGGSRSVTPSSRSRSGGRDDHSHSHSRSNTNTGTNTILNVRLVGVVLDQRGRGRSLRRHQEPVPAPVLDEMAADSTPTVSTLKQTHTEVGAEEYPSQAQSSATRSPASPGEILFDLNKSGAISHSWGD